MNGPPALVAEAWFETLQILIQPLQPAKRTNNPYNNHPKQKHQNHMGSSLCLPATARIWRDETKLSTSKDPSRVDL
jgi:hypothetical protein